MIHMDDATQSYLQQLLHAQELPGLMIRMRAINPGTVQGDCRLEFCEPEELNADDYVVENSAFSIVIDAASVTFLQDTELSYQQTATGSQLVVKAPHLKAKAPAIDGSLVSRVEHVIATEINPQVASHGGRVTLLELRADGTAVLQFGGGCQGCGMKDQTLKHGVEKTLRARVPELTAVLDATDHAAGKNPYHPMPA